MRSTTLALTAAALIAGILIGLSIPTATAHDKKRVTSDPPVSMQVNHLPDSYEYDIIILRGKKLYVTRYPASNAELPTEIKPYALLRD